MNGRLPVDDIEKVNNAYLNHCATFSVPECHKDPYVFALCPLKMLMIDNNHRGYRDVWLIQKSHRMKNIYLEFLHIVSIYAYVM